MRVTLTTTLLALSLAACGPDPREGSGGGGAVASAGSGGQAPSASSAATGGGPAESARCNRGPVSAVCNPYGVALEAGGLDAGSYWSLVEDVLDVPFYRPSALFLDRF